MGSLFTGMLSGAFGGGARAAEQVADAQIERKNKVDYAREISRMEEEKAMRLAEFQEQQRRSGALWDKTGEGGEASRTALGKELTIKSDADVEAQKKLGPVAAQNAALAATATADAAAEEAKKHAADPTYIAAFKTLKLADPEVAARIAQAKAAVNASNAHAGMLAVQTAGLKLDVEDKQKLNGLYDQASDILTNSEMTDSDRAKAFGKVQQQITLIKSKTGQTKERDPELDTQTVTEERTTGDTVTKVTRKEVRRKGEAEKDDSDPVLTRLKRNREAAEAEKKRETTSPVSTPPAAEVRAPRKPDAVTSSIEADMRSLVEQYQQARALYLAAAKTNDPQAIARYQAPMNEALKALQQEARERLGNSADAFLWGL